MNKTILLGVGNILYKDEGVGVYAALFIEKNYTFYPPIDIADGATLGFQLMTYFQDYENVIILDTVSIEDTPGSLYRLPAQELLGLGMYRKTAHEVEIVEMLEICSLLEKMAEVTIVGIVPQDIESVAIGLTSAVETPFNAFIELILAEIKKLGITVTPQESFTSLENIILSFDRR